MLKGLIDRSSVSINTILKIKREASIEHMLNLRRPFREADWRGVCVSERSE